MGIIKGEEAEIKILISQLWDAIKGMPNLPKGTIRYTLMLSSEDSDLKACHISESGFYWGKIKGILIKLGKLEDIETNSVGWSEK